MTVAKTSAFFVAFSRWDHSSGATAGLSGSAIFFRFQPLLSQG
jgi:hypothetical protein